MSLVFKALSDPTRRAILHLLRERDLTAGEIAEHFSLSKPTLSGHFAVLKDAGLVDVTRSGTSMIYRINASVLEDAMLDLMDSLKLGARSPGRDTLPHQNIGETP